MTATKKTPAKKAPTAKKAAPAAKKPKQQQQSRFDNATGIKVSPSDAYTTLYLSMMQARDDAGLFTADAAANYLVTKQLALEATRLMADAMAIARKKAIAISAAARVHD